MVWSFSVAGAWLLGGGSAAHAQDAAPVVPLYTIGERMEVVRYWNQPGRYVLGVRTMEKEGPVVARLMPEASVWLRAYNNVRRPGKTPPTKQFTPATDTAESKNWENWVSAKLNYDRWMAQTAADVSNAQLGIHTATKPSPAPPLPGVIPDDLFAAVGNPPAMYAPVLPRRYTITFDGEAPLVYTDNIAGGTSRNPSYRFAQGVISMGVRLREWSKTDLDALFAPMGLTAV